MTALSVKRYCSLAVERALEDEWGVFSSISVDLFFHQALMEWLLVNDTASSTNVLEQISLQEQVLRYVKRFTPKKMPSYSVETLLGYIPRIAPLVHAAAALENSSIPVVDA